MTWGERVVAGVIVAVVIFFGVAIYKAGEKCEAAGGQQVSELIGIVNGQPMYDYECVMP